MSLPEFLYLGWRAVGYRARRDILGNDRAGTYDAAIADDHAPENGDARPQPHVPPESCWQQDIGLRPYVGAKLWDPVV